LGPVIETIATGQVVVPLTLSVPVVAPNVVAPNQIVALYYVLLW